MGYNFGPIHINGNNQGFIFTASNPVTETWNRHIDVHFYAICNFMAQVKVKLFFIEGDENPALGQVKFHKFRNLLGLIFNQNAALCGNITPMH